MVDWKAVKIPGYAWFIIIPLAIIVIHTYFPEPYVWDLCVMVGGMLLRKVSDNDGDIRQLLGILNQYKDTLDNMKSQNKIEPGMRSMDMPSVDANLPPIPTAPQQTFMRKLLT